MPKTEPDGLPLYLMFKAIIYLRKNKYLAISPRIAPLVNRSSHHVSQVLTWMWLRGLIKRKNVKTQRTRRTGVNPARDTMGCSFHYTIGEKGKRKYRALQIRFGDIKLIASTGQVSLDVLKKYVEEQNEAPAL